MYHKLRLTRSIILVVVLAAALPTTKTFSQVRSTTGGGVWGEVSTWVDGVVPGLNDSVVIASGAEVVLQSQPTCRSLTVEAGAALSTDGNRRLIVTETVLNQGSIVGESGLVEAHGDVINQGVWTMRLHYGGDGPRNVTTPGVEGAQWVEGNVILENDNVMARLDAINSQTGQLTVQEGASLKFTVAPGLSYTPEGLGIPDDPELINRGTIIVPNLPSQYVSLVLGSDLAGSLETPDSDTLWAETHSDQLHPSYANSVRQWYRFLWSGSVDPIRTNFLTLVLFFDDTQLNGLDPGNLFVYHSPDGGLNWTRITDNTILVFFDPATGQGFTSLSNAPSQGDYVISDDQGPANSPPVAENDIEFTMESTDVLVDVLSNDYDPEGDPIRLISAANGSFGTTSVEGNQVRYTPAGGFTGEDSFTYVITDDVSGEAGATVTVRVADPATALFLQAGNEEPGPTDEVVRRRFANINFDHLDVLAGSENGVLTLNLFDDLTVVTDQTNSRRWSETEVAWFGASDRFGDWITFEFDTANRHFFATVWAQGVPYRIERQPDGTYAIDQLDLSGLIDDLDIDAEIDTSAADQEFTVLESWEIEGSSGGKKAGAVPGPEIDLLIVFTVDARDASGSQLNMRQEIFNAVNNTNQTYRNSGVNAVVRLAGTAMVGYDEASDSDKDLTNLTRSGQKSGRTISTLRNQFGADIVGLVTSKLGSSECGRANLMESVSNDHSKNAFFVVSRGNCLGGNLSFAHEIGHVQGARHDRFVDNTDGSPFNYNHGYVNPPNGWTGAAEQWRTVMAYNDACTCSDEISPCPKTQVTSGPSCTRLMFWSSPNLTGTGGNVMGIASGSNAADNVRTLNATAATVSGFSGALPFVSGTITDVSTGLGLANVSVDGISPTQGYTTLSDAAGFYAFLVPSGTSLVVTPNLDGYVFDPIATTISNINSDVVQDFDASPLFDVSGTVTLNGVGLNDVAVVAAPDQIVTTGSSGNYSLLLPWDWPGAVTPSHPAYDFIPQSVTFDTLRADTSMVDFTATVKQLTIDGFVNTRLGDPVSGVVIQGLPGNPVTNPNGYYSVVVDFGWAGSALPIKAGFSFEPFSRTYSRVASDLTHNYDAFAGGLARSEWPMWASSPLHSSRIDVSTFSSQSSWSATLEGRLYPPVVGQDGTIYAVTSSHLNAIESDGAKLWSIPLPNAAEASPAMGTAGTIYVPSGGQLISYNTFDQSQNWSFSTGDRILSSPAIDELGTIYVGSNNDSMFAVWPSGTLRWDFNTGGDVRSSPAIDASGNIYFGSDDGNVYALDTNGNELWRAATGGAVRSSPTITGTGAILVGTDADALVALNMSNGNELWRYSAGGDVRGTPALDTQGGIYFGAADNTFYALTPSGTLDWSYDTVGPMSASAAVSYTKVRQLTGTGADEEVVYIATENNVVYAFNIQTPSGFSDRLRWQYFGTSTSPVLTRAGLLTGTESDAISRLDALEPESRTLVQLSVLLNDFGGDFDPDKLAAILWLEEQGGPLALFPDPSGDPCVGGPLVIPNCPLTKEFGKFNPLVVAQGGRSLILGLAQWSQVLADVIDGTSTEGLLGTFPLSLTAGAVASVVIGGLLDPTGYALNPEGLSTELAVFQNTFSRESFSDPESVYLLTGNFSTDATALDFSLIGDQLFDFSALSFGNLSDVIAVPEGIYEMAILGAGLGKNAGQVLASATLDLSGKAGEIVALYATGFMDPSANGGGPPLGVTAASGSGDVLISQPVGTQTREIPQQLTLDAVYPNPVSRLATVLYEIPNHQHVRIELFDMLGRRVLKVVDDEFAAGSQRSRLDATLLSSGVYVLRLVSGSEIVTRKLMVVR